MGKFIITEEERRSIRGMYLMEQVTTSGQSVNQMVDGPFTFVREANNSRQYYIYKQGKTDQEAKFFVYYQDNPTNPIQPDKLTRLGNLSHATKDLAEEQIQNEIESEKSQKQDRDGGGYEY